MSEYPQFWLYGNTVVRMEETEVGGLRVMVFNDEGYWTADSTYRSRIFHDRDNMTRQLTEAEYLAEMERRE